MSRIFELLGTLETFLGKIGIFSATVVAKTLIRFFPLQPARKCLYSLVLDENGLLHMR